MVFPGVSIILPSILVHDHFQILEMSKVGGQYINRPLQRLTMQPLINVT